MKHPLSPYLRPPSHRRVLLTVAAGILLLSPTIQAADLDLDGLPDDWEFLNAGNFAVWPPDLDQTLLPHDTATRSFLLSNDTAAAVNFTATVTDNTAPIYGAYDSITGGVAYAWDEISPTGTRLNNVSNADDSSEPETITGFTFPLYETRSLISALGTTFTNQDIHVFYVNSLEAAGSTPRGIALADFYFPASEDPYLYNCFASASKGPFTAGHELAHLLADEGHHSSTTNLLRNGTSTANTIDASKRLTTGQESKIHSNTRVTSVP